MVLIVPRIAVEDVLDRLLPIAPGGVREVPVGRHVELRLRGDRVPERAALVQAAGRWPHKLAEREIPDDWRARRLADYRPEAIAERLLVRPEWAPPAPSGMIELVLGESSAFGAGTHPTTRRCLEWLLEVPVLGAFADLGCGTGVIALLAWRLGWRPVCAVDIDDDSVAAALANAERNGSQVNAMVADLSLTPPPGCDGFAANVPAALHTALASRWASPKLGLISGFGPRDASRVLGAYSRAGLHEHRRIDLHGWVIAELRRDQVGTCSRSAAA
ncbi:MAG: ribosomal protein methyltransferase [Solirubrobacteraceae bacterium]|nr:ribosomal protein methyltransferase [Solirubrobacteraceae bacterium]